MTRESKELEMNARMNGSKQKDREAVQVFLSPFRHSDLVGGVPGEDQSASNPLPSSIR